MGSGADKRNTNKLKDCCQRLEGDCCKYGMGMDGACREAVRRLKELCQKESPTE